jgi:predicted aldo/keto reductase-like oxidoreductase
MPSNHHFSRREFLKTAGAVTAGSLLGGAAALADDGTPPATETSPKPRVPTRPFGKTGVRVSCLSLGGMFDIPNNQLVLKQALNWGVTYWDTADCYSGGRSETGIGQYFAKNPEARKQVFLVTKSDKRDPKGMSDLLARSLERLQTDYIDLYFIHGIGNIRELNDETKAWAAKAKADGKIKFFGFSTHENMAACLTSAASLGWIDGIMFSYNYRTMNNASMKIAVDACAKAGIGLTAMKTIGRGPKNELRESDLKLLNHFTEKGFTPEQAMLKVVWENPQIACVCSQMPSLNLLATNVAAVVDKMKLSALDKRLLEQHARETSCDFCAGCSEICQSALATEVPVHNVMRYLMYHQSYGERELARELFAQMPLETRNSLARLDYSAAEQRCPQGLAIGRLMEEASVVLA